MTVNPLQQVQTTVVGLGDVNKRDIYEAVISPYVEELGFPEDGIFLEYRVKPGRKFAGGIYWRLRMCPIIKSRRRICRIRSIC